MDAGGTGLYNSIFAGSHAADVRRWRINNPILWERCIESTRRLSLPGPRDGPNFALAPHGCILGWESGVRYAQWQRCCSQTWQVRPEAEVSPNLASSSWNWNMYSGTILQLGDWYVHLKFLFRFYWEIRVSSSSEPQIWSFCLPSTWVVFLDLELLLLFRRGSKIWSTLYSTYLFALLLHL